MFYCSEFYEPSFDRLNTTEPNPELLQITIPSTYYNKSTCKEFEHTLQIPMTFKII